MARTSLPFAKGLPIAAKKDVVVIGGGPTGVPAALSAARAGADTMLVEQHGWVGGQINQEMPLIGFLDSNGKQIIRGLGDEIIKRLVALRASPGHIRDEHEASFTPLDSRMFNAVSFQMFKEAGVTVLLDSYFADVIMEGETIKAAVVANKSGLQAIEGKVFVDATGDADIVGRAGAPFTKGGSDGKMMALLLWMLFYNVDWERFRDALMEDPQLYDVDPDTPGISGEGMKPEYFQKTRFVNFWGFRNLVREAQKKGYKPGNWRVGVWCPGRMDQGGYASLRYETADGTNDATDGGNVSEAEMELRMMVPDAVSFIHDWLPGWRDAVLASVSPILGVQDTRIATGEYTLTEDDILTSRRFEDVIAVGGAKIDDWETYKMIYPKGNYDIPYRCLVPKGVENLLVGGRSISATRKAMMSVRAMGICTATGQAAGAAAALCAKGNISPRRLDHRRLRELLLQQGVYLGSGELDGGSGS